MGNDDSKESLYNKSKFDIFLERLFFCIPLAFISRWLITFYSDENYFDSKSIGDVEKSYYYFLTFLGAISLWQIFVRRKCPTCKSTSYRHVSTEEIDRYLGQKKVTETTKLANGKTSSTRERHVQVTYVVIEDTYRCKKCGTRWGETTTKEL